jgi:hypothetical protein
MQLYAVHHRKAPADKTIAEADCQVTARYALPIALVAIVAAVGVAAQSDTARGTVGGTLCFRRALAIADSSCAFRALLRLSNPTVWYPISARIGTDSALLVRRSDTLWLVSCDSASGDRSIELCGIVLAGSDSVCIVTLDSLVACRPLADSIVQVLVVSSIGPPLPYVRFARMEGPFPHPIARVEPFVVYIGLDAASTVALRMYDVLGRHLLEWRDTLDRGVHRIELRLPEGTSPGVYVLRLDTATGSVRAVAVVE